VYLEVVAHMTCAALLCGWGSDFQAAILAVCSLAFFSEYLCRCLNIGYAPGLPLCMVGTVAYLVTCAVCALRPAPYALPDSASLLLKLAWGIIVFSVLIAFLRAFAVEATRSQKALTDRMSHDKLTGLPNRYYAAEYLDEIFKGNDPGRYWLAIADIDDFKVVNDTYGHNCGGLVLSTIASLLDNNLGRTLVCRW
jgi:predicted signal transduction protein with EAL and GGDEF domain